MMNDKDLKGVVTSRMCPMCGHHEMGYTTVDGVFYPLKPGTPIQVLRVSDKEKEPPVGPEAGPRVLETVPWVPAAIITDRALRLKFGVMVEKGLTPERIHLKVYQDAYLEKLRSLIEKEMDVPLAVILDRFFAAPHLASGNPKQVAEALWRELDEVQRPVILVGEWLEKQDEESFVKMIHPRTVEDITGTPPGQEQLTRELEDLSLGEFLEVL